MLSPARHFDICQVCRIEKPIFRCCVLCGLSLKYFCGTGPGTCWKLPEFPVFDTPYICNGCYKRELRRGRPPSESSCSSLDLDFDTPVNKVSNSNMLEELEREKNYKMKRHQQSSCEHVLRGNCEQCLGAAKVQNWVNDFQEYKERFSKASSRIFDTVEPHAAVSPRTAACVDSLEKLRNQYPFPILPSISNSRSENYFLTPTTSEVKSPDPLSPNYEISDFKISEKKDASKPKYFIKPLSEDKRKLNITNIKEENIEKLMNKQKALVISEASSISSALEESNKSNNNLMSSDLKRNIEELRNNKSMIDNMEKKFQQKVLDGSIDPSIFLRLYDLSVQLVDVEAKLSQSKIERQQLTERLEKLENLLDIKNDQPTETVSVFKRKPKPNTTITSDDECNVHIKLKKSKRKDKKFDVQMFYAEKTLKQKKNGRAEYQEPRPRR